MTRNELIGKTLRIGYRTFTIRDCKDYRDELGSCSRLSATLGMEFSDRHDPEEFSNTLLHELIHAAMKVNNDEQSFKSSEVYEDVITRLANTLHQTFRENREIIQWLLDEID